MILTSRHVYFINKQVNATRVLLDNHLDCFSFSRQSLQNLLWSFNSHGVLKKYDRQSRPICRNLISQEIHQNGLLQFVT
jgi:hypothetical protein